MKPRRSILPDTDHQHFLSGALDQSADLYLDPGKLLKLVRTTLRMSQDQLARRSRFPQAHIARIESGRVDAQWSSLVRLFEALHCRLVPHVRPEGSLESIMEKRIGETAKRRIARSKSLFPGESWDARQEQEAERDWQDTLRSRRTSEIWDDDA